MPKPRRKKQPEQKVHDRRAIDALAVLQAVPVEVVNPLDPDKGKIVVLATTRDDLLRRLHSSKAIDDACFAAGRSWEEDWQRAQLGHTSSGGQWRERVQGGGVSGEIITDRVRKAVKKLAEADRALGIQGCALVRDILGRGMTTKVVAIKHLGTATQRNMNYITKRFGECLETLVVVYQLGSGK
jgi:hypothetical protein